MHATGAPVFHMPERLRACALHIDIDSFSFEGFTNGATIQYREMLLRFQDLGIDSAVVTIGQAKSSVWATQTHGCPDRRWHIDQDIAIGEYLVSDCSVSAPQLYKQVIDTMINDTQPDLVIVNTPPARLEEAEVFLFEALAQTRARKLCFVPDNQFPKIDQTDSLRFERLRQALRCFSIVAPSQFIADAVSSSGLGPCKVFGNAFSRHAILNKKIKPKYITFINPHPMKGVEIFLEIARRLPHRKFQAIRGWPYPPNFNCDLPNVIVRPFTPDMAGVWHETALLLVPSLCHEAFGRVVIEAQLNGIPVVAHDIGGLSEAAGDGALMVPAPHITGNPVFPKLSQSEFDRSVAGFCDYIETIHEDKGAYASLISRAQENAEKWIARGDRDTAQLAAPFTTQSNNAPSVITLAPHPDDAAFSVGGLMRAWHGPKEIVTVFGRSNFVKEAGFLDNIELVSSQRRKEDETYCRKIDASLTYWDQPEASLRRAPCWKAIFSIDMKQYAARDQGAKSAIKAGILSILNSRRPELLLAPAALGGHSDHLLVRNAALSAAHEKGVPIALYEDLPYASALSEAKIYAEITELISEPSLVYVPILKGLSAKLSDAKIYASQIGPDVLAGLEQHAKRWPAPSERLWSTSLITPIIARGLKEPR